MNGFRLTFFAAVAAFSVAEVFSSKCCFTGSSGKQRCMMSGVGCNQCNLAGVRNKTRSSVHLWVEVSRLSEVVCRNRLLQDSAQVDLPETIQQLTDQGASAFPVSKQAGFMPPNVIIYRVLTHHRFMDISEVQGNIYIPIGCFGGLPVDNHVYNFRSHPTLWKKWPDFSWLAKLCAEKALAAGWDLFSLEFWGLCRGGNLTDVTNLGWDTFALEYGPQCWPGVLTQQNYGMGLPRLVDQSRCFQVGMKAGTFDCVGGTAGASHSFVYHIQRNSAAAGS